MSEKIPVIQEPWYHKGLSFKCTECGQCCTGQGYTWVSEEEIISISQFLKITPQLFKRKYIRQKGHRLALIELSKKDYACPFLEGKRCQIYPVRPKQCQTFPYWPYYLKSEENWKELERACEGVHQEDKVPFEEIQKKHNDHVQYLEKLDSKDFSLS